MLSLVFSHVADDYEELTVGATAVGLSSEKLTRSSGALKHLPAELALLSVEGADIRYRLEGTATQATGHLVPAGESLVIGKAEILKRLSMIRAAGTSATLRVTYFY